MVVRVTGALVGLGLVFAVVSPTKGVPPRGGSGALAPAQIEVQVQGAGEFEIVPIGTVLEPTAFPPPGQRGGPKLAVTVRNITGVPLMLSIRLLGVSPTLDRAVKVRASVAGAVVLNGPLGKAGEWSAPAGLLRSGQQSTLRMRFKLLEGIPPDSWHGRLDVRQLEFKAVNVDGQAVGDSQSVPSTSVPSTTAGPPAPAPTTPASTPVTTPATTPATTP